MATVVRRTARAVRSRIVPALALVGALAPLALTPLPTSAAPRSAQVPVPADTPVEDISVVVDEVDPVVLTPGEPVTLTGRLLNGGTVPHRMSFLTATASSTGLTSRRQVSDWLSGELVLDRSVALGDDTVGPVVPPGAAVPFQVVVPASVTEDLPAAPQVLPVVLSATEDEGEEESDPVELRTTVVSGGSGELDTPLEVSWVVPLTLPADADLVSPQEAAHAAAWTQAVGPDSDISGWLQDLELPAVTYIVDPAALVGLRPSPALTAGGAEPTGTETPSEPAPTPDDSVETAGPDESVATEPGGDADDGGSTAPAPVPDVTATTEPPDDEAVATEPGPTATAADVADVVATLRTTLAGLPDDQVWWLPSNDPDLQQLVRHGAPDDLADDLLSSTPSGASELVQPVLATGRRDVAWPLWSAPDAEDLTAVQDLFRTTGGDTGQDIGQDTDLGAVLVPRESFTADSAAPPRRGAIPLRQVDGVTALGVDSWTSALVAASEDAALSRGSGAAAQEVLAHTVGTYLEDPTSARELVIAPPRLSPASPEVLQQLSEGWRAAPWIRPVAAHELLDRAEGTEALRLTGRGPQPRVLGDLAERLAAGESPLDEERVDAMATTGTELDHLEGILRDPSAAQSWRSALATLWSARWRDDEDQWVIARQTVRDDVRSARDGVTVTPSTVNFLTDQGEISVTVVNRLGAALDDVVLELVASNGRLQVIRQPDPVSIGADSRASVSFEARSITRGETTLTATLRTPAGTTLGEPVPIEVRVQPTGVWVYWVLGGLAGLVLILGLSRSLRRGGPATPAPQAPGDAESAEGER
ncbi:DUF6049 family protein [Serinicoccus kebangsaanensis]|uniref:DUF6049 family protein n=1 Tax=Serinicoccus kebangsaanensis TaxID=2602069 RepID=UPI00124EF1BF|nr:DUF6049 family protein [Serinicoccus kebangsaanensis]